MKRFVVALFVALIGLATGAQAEPARVVRLGVEGAYPPFNEIGPDGKPRGLDIDVAEALCAEMKVRCVWVVQNWDGMIPALLAGKFDAIVSSMAVTPERKQKIAFTDSYYAATGSLVARRGATFDPKRPETLRGKRVGVQAATTHETYAKSVLVPAGVRVVVYPTQDEVYADLRNGRIDASLQDTPLAAAGFLRTPEGKPFAFAGPPISDPKLFGEGVGIGLRKSDAALVAQFNAALKRIRANGVYAQIDRRWFGDGKESAGLAGAEAGSSDRGAMGRYAGALATGVGMTLKVTAGAFVLSVMLGLAAALARVYGGASARAVSLAYVAAARGAPDFIWLLFLYYGGQAALNYVAGGPTGQGRVEIGAFGAGVVILGLVYGGYLAETFRGALLAVSRGQIEAAVAFGLGRGQVFSKILFPQMMRFALPGLGNNWLVVVKASAMTSMVNLNELLFMATAAGRASHRVLAFLLVAGGVYLVITTVSVAALRLLERHYGSGERAVIL